VASAEIHVDHAVEARGDVLDGFDTRLIRLHHADHVAKTPATAYSRFPTSVKPEGPVEHVPMIQPLHASASNFSHDLEWRLPY
jgi:hypothetical protein